MVERVAQALCRKQFPEGGFTLEGKMIPREEWVGRNWHFYVPLARAAIEAMREPTEEMIDACGNGECAKWAPGAWTAMISAALGAGPMKGDEV